MYFDEEIITELDLMPLMWRKAGYALFRGVPVGQVHRPDEPCPYQGRDFARNPSLHCCWLRGEKVYWELTKLDALFDGTLAAELASDKCTAEEALAFADKLRKLADEHEVVHREERTPGIRGSVREIDASGMFVSEVRYSTFEEVLATLRKTADWFELTGRLGCGVRVWG